MQGHILQSAVTLGPDYRHTRDGLRIEHAVLNESEAAGSLGDQHSAVRQKGDGPGMRQAACHHTHTNPVLLGRIEDPGPGAQRRYGDAD